jgi:hypothetical protein
MKKVIKTPIKIRKPIDPAKKFERVFKNFTEKTPLHYKMDGSFKKDDVIDHDTFGKGVVISNEYKYIDVLFTDKLRTLVCDR